MARLACVDIPNVSLQLVLQQHPWHELPVAVVSEDKPLGTVTELNRAAARHGIKSGMRYATALTLCPNLHASPVSAALRESGLHRIHELLYTFTPEVERCGFDEGTFWANAQGLLVLYPSLEHWSTQLEKALQDAGFFCRIAVGFTRFGTYAETKSGRKRTVFSSVEAEREAVTETRLSHLPLPHRHRHALSELGVETVRQLLSLPESGIRERFGREVAELYHFVSGRDNLPVQPSVMEEAYTAERNLPSPIISTPLLIPVLEELLAELTKHCRSRGEQIRELLLTMQEENGSVSEERIRPAHPTTDAALLARLLKLRLEQRSLTDAVTRVALGAERVRAQHDQLALFHHAAKRDLEAGAQAFARLRAVLGNDSIQHAVLQDAHFPEQRVRWEPMQAPVLPQPAAGEGEQESTRERDQDGGRDGSRERERRLVRRILETPEPWKPRLSKSTGPFLYSAPWWHGEEQHDRAYHFVYTERGTILWVYFDYAEQRWMIQGLVE